MGGLFKKEVLADSKTKRVLQKGALELKVWPRGL